MLKNGYVCSRAERLLCKAVATGAHRRMLEQALSKWLEQS